MVKNPLANAGDTRERGLIPGWGKALGEGNGNPLQYSFFENIFIYFNWRLITLQYYSGFCHTLT